MSPITDRQPWQQDGHSFVGASDGVFHSVEARSRASKSTEHLAPGALFGRNRQADSANDSPGANARHCLGRCMKVQMILYLIEKNG